MCLYTSGLKVDRSSGKQIDTNEEKRRSLVHFKFLNQFAKNIKPWELLCLMTFILIAKPGGSI